MAEAADFFGRLGTGYPETMAGFVDALGGPGRGHGTRNAAGTLGFHSKTGIRQVQRVILGERLKSGEEQAYNAQGEPIKWSGKGKVYSATGVQREPRNLSPAQHEKMVGIIREENKNVLDPAKVKREGLTVTKYRGDFDYDGGHPDDEPDRTIGARVHIPGSQLQRFLDALQRGEKDEASAWFDEAFFDAYGYGTRMWDVTQLEWRVGG